MRLRTLPACLTLLACLALPAAAQFETVPTPAPEPVPVPADGSTPAGAEAAPRDMALYTGESELMGQGAGERRAATARALAQVVVKLTGEPLASANPVVRRALSNAAAFVLAEQTGEEPVDQHGNTAIGGVPVYKTSLQVQFDPNKVDALIAGAGLPYWGAERPRPLLWLAIDDGRGPRLVSSQQLNVVKPLAGRGTERGLSFALPAGSSVEQAAVQTIWSRNPGQMQALSERYGAGTQLLGRLFREGQGWTADWVLSRGGEELSRWSFSDPSPQRALASGADGAADAIARRDAVRAVVGEPESIEVRITGLASAGDFARAMGYLQTLPVVAELTVVEATPDSLRLGLKLAVDRATFDGFLAAGDVLAADAAASDEATAGYRLRP
ncbi:DUF2066 domain-containing protein [Arenimonas caeni]|uniref:DUF2066 domain-containing protein n=1 Tax=Arenimonas caeni TaxID=2058085 RepID=A0A2P6MBT6_9GAMM|nr:DUF2066 domain-containing protein [Arenimonas caeni]PRH83426.1 hypothetical protein C6N40_01895 [Arenimonas caeni]